MLDNVLVNGIVNALQADRRYIERARFNNYCNAYIPSFELIQVTIGNTDYYVLPIMSYTTIVGFAYDGVVYEVGKHSRTTAKQFTQICNTYFPNYVRSYVEKRYY